MLASKSYCFPYKTLGQSCDASALLVNMENEVRVSEGGGCEGKGYKR